MDNREQLDILRSGVAAWNEWIGQHPQVKPSFQGANLSGLDLSGAELRGADLRMTSLKETRLRGADLNKAKLNNAYMRRADLRGADLTDASLSGANLRHAVLRDVKLARAYMRRADLSYADLRGADLSEAQLEYSRFVDTQVDGMVLRNCSIYGVSVWNLIGSPKEQSGLILTRRPIGRAAQKAATEPTIKVDNLAVAQFVYLLLHHQSLRDIFNSVTQRGVLLLGRFGGGGLDVLHAIAAALREKAYLPILFDFERPQDRDYTETILTLAGLARFVIVDLSGPSVPQELYATVPNLSIPFVPILEKGRQPYSLFATLFKYDWVLRPIVEFASTDELIQVLPEKILQPAEERLQKRQALLQELFPAKAML